MEDTMELSINGEAFDSLRSDYAALSEKND